MTDHPDPYGAALRRCLVAEADTVHPSPDGLERIRRGRQAAVPVVPYPTRTGPPETPKRSPVRHSGDRLHTVNDQRGDSVTTTANDLTEQQVDEFVLEVLAIAVLDGDRVVHIGEEGDLPERDVNCWQVTSSQHRQCAEHGTWHVDVDYTEPNGTKDRHTFKDQETPVTVVRRIERAPMADADPEPADEPPNKPAEDEPAKAAA